MHTLSYFVTGCTVQTYAVCGVLHAWCIAALGVLYRLVYTLQQPKRPGALKGIHHSTRLKPF